MENSAEEIPVRCICSAHLPRDFSSKPKWKGEYLNEESVVVFTGSGDGSRMSARTGLCRGERLFCLGAETVIAVASPDCGEDRQRPNRTTYLCKDNQSDRPDNG